jgi:cytoskeletal protein CcmA (bactofilin family)
VALWSGIGVVLYPAMNIAGDVYCDGVLNNAGSINGDCFADSLAGNAISGQTKAKTELQLSRPTINSSILTTNFTTQSISDNNLNSTTLGGATQVFYRSGDLRINSNVTINGCLAVDGNLTISGISNIITAKKNVPAIYVSGNLIIKENASLDCNGLVFVDGRVEMPIINQSVGITGALFTDDGIRHIVPDYSSQKNNGIINGDCTLAAGFTNGAINFDGSGDFIDIGNATGLSITKKISIAAFIKVNDFNKPSQAIITKGNNSWRLQRYGSTNFVEFVCTGIFDGSVHGSKNVNDGLWHHIAAVREDTVMSLYVDGMPDGTQVIAVSDNINTNSDPVYIGENSGATGKYFNGLIDDVRVYNIAISSDNVWDIIDGITVPGNLVGYWTMDWGNSTTTITAAPVKAAIYHWPGGVKDRWSPAAGAFYKSIARNP